MAIDISDYPNKIKTNLWANKSFTVFYYNFKVATKKHRGIIDLSDKQNWNKRDKISVAEAELIKIKADKKDGVLSDKITLDKFLDKHYKLHAETNWKKTRLSFYDTYISPHIGKKPIVSIRQLHIKEVIKIQENKNLAARTVKQTFEVLNPVFKAAIANRLMVHNPLDGIKIKLPKTKKIVTNATEKLIEIYKAIHEEFGEDPFYLSLYLFGLQGRRRGEILTLRWENINFNDNYYVLRDTKNNEEQKLFLPNSIKNELAKFKSNSGWVYHSRKTGTHMVDIRKATDKLKKRLNDENFGIHYLRNVIVSAMAERGLDAIHLSGALGHNDPNTITKYLTMNYLKGSELASGVIDGIMNK
jgi:integrase